MAKKTPTEDDEVPDRNEELLGNEELEDDVREFATAASKAFEDQWERGNDQIDYWRLYDCNLGPKQGYAGNAQIFVPIIKEAVDARRTRFVNQIFPRSQRNIECISSDEKPQDVMALVEHYIRKCRLQTQVMPALFKNGDVEGQYNVYAGWRNSKRYVTYRKPAKVEVADGEEIEDIDGEEEVDTEEIEHQEPTVEVLSDVDVAVWPPTSNSVDEAIENGGGVAIMRRWTKGRIERAIREKEIDKAAGEDIIKELQEFKRDPQTPDVIKAHVDAAGISMGEGGKVLNLYEMWVLLELDEGHRLCRAYFAGGKGDWILSIKRCPYWNDKCPLLSAPVDKIANVFKGQSKLQPVERLQIAANDAINKADDSSSYSLLPIVMTDPAKNPRVGSMVMNLAAIWETNPKDTQFAQFPALWKDGLQIVAAYKTEIFQALSVSPAIMPQSSGGKSKRNQAEIAAEQQIDVLTTADVCTTMELEILTQLVRRFVDYDYQYRKKEVTVHQYGQMGVRANMQKIPPIQSDRRFEFKWYGVEAARNAQMLQMRIAGMNVLNGIPPDKYPGYTMNMVPIIEAFVEETYGVRVAPQIFQDLKSKLSIEAEMENSLLVDGLALPVHALDDDKKHLQEHQKVLKDGDPTGAIREHMMLHTTQMSKKMQMQQAAMAQMQRGQPGAPGGAGPGVAGTPRQGAAPGVPRGGQQPPGAVHQDRIPEGAPRR